VEYGDFSQMSKFWLAEREPIQYIPDPGGTIIVIEPEDPAHATLSGEVQISSSRPWTVEFADDDPGAAGVAGNTGVGTVTLVNPLPVGTYIVSFGWQTVGWDTTDPLILITLSGLGAGGQENGTLEPGGPHDVRPNNGFAPNETSPFYNDELIGPSMGPTASVLPTSGWGSNLGDWGTSLTVGAGNQVSFEFDERANPGSMLLYDITFVPAIVQLPLPVVSQDIIVQAEDCNPVPTQATSPDSYVRVTTDGAFVMSNFEDGGGTTDNVTGTGTFTIPVAIPDGNYEVMVRLNTGAIIASGGNWGIRLGATTGSVIENGGGGGTEHSYNPLAPNTLPNTWYDSWFASPEGDAAWYGDIWNFVDGGPTPQLPTSVTLSGIGADDLFFEFRDGMNHNSSYTFIDYFRFVPVIPGDFDQSDLVDCDDLLVFVEQWLHCNDPTDPGCTDIVCGSKPVIGITDYTAYDVTTTSPAGAVTVDGDLSDWPPLDTTEGDTLWCARKWVELDQIYSGSTSPNIENVFMCLMYDDTANLVYGAVVAHDFDPQYGWTAWNQQDSIEVYIQGDISANCPPGDPNNDPYNTWAIGQQFMIGIEPNDVLPNDPAHDCTFTLWPDGTDFEVGPDPSLTAVAKRIVNGPLDDNLIYEFALVPYDNYGGYNLTPDVLTDLAPGKQFGFDVVLSNLDPSFFSFMMRCANDQKSKSNDVTAYGTATCE
jgi:hypothetical protein